jgi:formylglycine-generating enzyme required for sulfatase activity
MRPLCLVLPLAVVGCSLDWDKRAEESPVDTDRWVSVRPGAFVRGAPKTEFCRRGEPLPESAEIERGFRIAPYEVTQRQFESLMGYNPSFSSTCTDCPVDSVSWHEAAAYAVAASSQAGLDACYTCSGTHEEVRCSTNPTCNGLRLPTDEEWEYAARAGTTTATYAGRVTSCMSKDEVADQIAWYKANSGGFTHRVGEKESNPWGLHDVLGNVSEWTHDGPAGPSLRGGSWYHNAERSRAAHRLQAPLDAHLSYAGFRLVRPLDAAAAD